MEHLINIYKEFDKHLMEDDRPSLYFNKEIETGEFFNIYPLTLLGDLTATHQSPKFHPEGSVWNHTMLVTDEAAKRKHLSEDPRVFMWAALLHDIGKPSTTKLRKGKITSYDHDKVGEELSIKFLKEFTNDEEFISKVSKLIRWHMQPLFVIKNFNFVEIDKMAAEASIEEIALLALCDRLGRGEMTEKKIEEEREGVNCFLRKSHEYLNFQGVH